jgi:MgsA AAA+ ATPase C terminal
MHSLFPSDDDWKDRVLDRIADVGIECDTPALLRCDRWIAASLLQKAIRRSETQLALRAAQTLSSVNRSYTWRRLLVIAFEDVGAADSEAVIETVAVATTPKWRSSRGEMESLAYAVTRLAEAPKDRSADYLISAAESHPSLSDARERCLKADLQDRLRIVRELSRPLPVRSLAAWLSSGIQAHNGPRIGAGSLRQLSRTLVELGASEDFVSSIILAAKRTREPMVTLVPLIWLESQRDQFAKIRDEAVPESPVLDGIPMYAFDKHTRLGLTAIHRLIQESDRLRYCLEQYVPKEAWRRAAQMAAFYTDAYLVSHRLEWSLSRPLEELGIESDFCSVRVSHKALIPLRQALRHEVGKLNQIRQELWELQAHTVSYIRRR